MILIHPAHPIHSPLCYGHHCRPYRALGFQLISWGNDGRIQCKSGGFCSLYSLKVGKILSGNWSTTNLWQYFEFSILYKGSMKFHGFLIHVYMGSRLHNFGTTSPVQDALLLTDLQPIYDNILSFQYFTKALWNFIVSGYMYTWVQDCITLAQLLLDICLVSGDKNMVLPAWYPCYTLLTQLGLLTCINSGPKSG